MAATIQDVVSANLVLVGVSLISTPDEVEQFRSSIGGVDLQEEFGLAGSLPAGLVEPNRRLTLNRDRIFLTLSPSRSSISREYPSLENLQADLERLSEVSTQAIKGTNLGSQNLVAFGYNAEVIFNQDSGDPAIRYLGGRLFGHSFPRGKPWDLSGGSGQLIFTDGTRRWTFSVRPRSEDERESRVALGLNLHLNQQNLPNKVEIRNSLEEVWTEANEFMKRLDENR